MIWGGGGSKSTFRWNQQLFIWIFLELKTIEQSAFASAMTYNAWLIFLVYFFNDPKQFFFEFSGKCTNAALWRVGLYFQDWQIAKYNRYSFRLWKYGLENHFFIHLSCITIATQGGIFKQFFCKKFYKFFKL